jgi:hypothetical protein
MCNGDSIGSGFHDAPNGLKMSDCKIPLAVKVAGTAFLAILVPVYLHTYGPTNFLWFCDAALILTVAGMWMESSLLTSMCAVGILLPQCLWLADFGSNFFGFHFLNLTSYMFDSHLPLFTRGLSLFHGWLPLLLVWLLFRLGYDKRALSAWTVVAAGLMLICYFFTPPAGRNTGSTKICISSYGWAHCGSAAFSPRIWHCAKSSPRRRVGRFEIPHLISLAVPTRSVGTELKKCLFG